MRCREADVHRFIGVVGDTYDNAAAQALFARLACGLLDGSQAGARMALFHVIEGFGDPARCHSALGYLPPIDFEARNTTAGD